MEKYKCPICGQVLDSKEMFDRHRQTVHGSQISGSQSYMSQSMMPQVLSAGTLKGDKVVNLSDEDLGDIKEIMIDLKDGRVAYVVLEHGGVAGVGGKLFAIPWEKLKVDTENHRFILDISKETLDNAEGFDKDDWPGTHTSDSSWRNKAFTLFPLARPM